MKKFFRLLPLVAIGLLPLSCSTDIDLLDNYKETAIVYGLLNQADSVQYIRINKAYLGEGNALIMAQQFDSINYANSLDVKIEEYYNGGLTNTFQLQRDSTMFKQPGTFYAPKQILYRTPPGQTLVYGKSYKLIVKNSATGNVTTGQTDLVDGSGLSITYPLSSIGFNANPANPNLVVSPKWTSTNNGRIYSAAFRIHYNETDLSNVTTPKVIEWNIGTSKSTNTLGGENMSFDVKPDDFYRFIANNVADDANVVSRTATSIDFVVYVGADDLSTYIDVNGPSSSVVQDRPVYTNITNGLGIFSTRYRKEKNNLIISPVTIDSLAGGRFTCHLRFKDRNGNVTGCQ
jgi:hypothetical protein